MTTLQTIVLNEEDTKQYEKIRQRLGGGPVNSRTIHRNVMLRDFFRSPRYSFDLKRKIVFYLPYLEPSGAWGFENLNSTDDLYSFIKHQFEFTIKEAQLLARNPHFLLSGDSSKNCLHAFLTQTFESEGREKVIKNEVIRIVIHSEGMSFAVAETIVAANKLLGSGNYGKIIDMAPLIVWLRKTYGLEALPEAWVLKFIGLGNG